MPTNTPPPDRDPAFRERTRAALCAAWRDVQKAAENLPHPADVLGDLPDLLAASRRLSAMDKRLTCMTVVALATDGRTWEEIGEMMGRSASDAELLYGDAVARWREGDAAPWAPRLSGVTAAGPAPAGQPQAIDAP